VIDRQGSAIAVTVSNGEGNGALVPGCGFMPNNMLGEEDVNPRGFHRWGPGHRMASMMAPSLVTGSDGAVTALGSGGSNRIRTAIFQVTAHRMCLSGLPLDEAVRLPRVHCEKGFLDIEGGVPKAKLEALKTAFPEHRHWEGQSLYFGGVHALSRGGKGAIDGAGDPRRAGCLHQGLIGAWALDFCGLLRLMTLWTTGAVAAVFCSARLARSAMALTVAGPKFPSSDER
jgi:gamma-glutamyltranspeptidase/glutathione hydrolase